MNKFKTQKKLALLWTLFAFAVALVNLLIYVFGSEPKSWWTYLLPNVGALALLSLLFYVLGKSDSDLARVVMILILLIPAGPSLVFSDLGVFGMFMFVTSVGLAIKWIPNRRHQLWFLLLEILYFSPWLVVSVQVASDGGGSLLRAANYLLFLATSFGNLYVLFEEEIRDLLVSNKQKDVELAEQAAEIARLEPLSVLGERVAHVAHSFKNNLNQISTALFYLEQTGEAAKAVQKIRDFRQTLNERIENILMVSRAGADLDPEVFDAARLLEGLKHVYLTEQAFLRRAKSELDLPEATPIQAVRWDFILLVENILNNALEAITAKGVYGTIQITLKNYHLTIANDGGAMARCSGCGESCLMCEKWGRPGRTTKPGGTGHGLSQVFLTCRKNHWDLRIRTHDDWTSFEISLATSATNLLK